MCLKMVEGGDKKQPKKTPKNKKKFSNSKVLKMILRCLVNCQCQEVISWIDEKKGEFKIKFMHKNNPSWTESLLSLFMISEQVISEKRYNKYKESEKHSEDTKCRFRANINRLVKKTKDLEFLKEKRMDDNSKVKSYRFANYSDEFKNHLLKAKETKGNVKMNKKEDEWGMDMQVSAPDNTSGNILKFTDVSCNIIYISLPTANKLGSGFSLASPQSSEFGSGFSHTSSQISKLGSGFSLASPQSSELGSGFSLASPQSSRFSIPSPCNELSNGLSTKSSYSAEHSSNEGWPEFLDCLSKDNLMDKENSNFIENHDLDDDGSNFIGPTLAELNMFVRTVSVPNSEVVQSSPFCSDMDFSSFLPDELSGVNSMDISLHSPGESDEKNLTKLENMVPSLDINEDSYNFVVSSLDINEESF